MTIEFCTFLIASYTSHYKRKTITYPFYLFYSLSLKCISYTSHHYYKLHLHTQFDCFFHQHHLTPASFNTPMLHHSFKFHIFLLDINPIIFSFSTTPTPTPTFTFSLALIFLFVTCCSRFYF